MDSHLDSAEQGASMSADNASSSTPRFVSDEAALGQRLNQAVQQQQRADFAYLLAMLSDNVLEHSASALRKQQNVEPAWQPPFAYGPAVPLAAQPEDFIQSPSAHFHRSRVDWRLHYALCPEGLNPVNDALHISHQVRDNCAHFVQQRIRDSGATSAESSTQAAQDNPFQAENLLDIIDSLRGVERAVA